MMTMADENWDVLRSAFPTGWEQLARETGAIKHPLKAFRSEGDLLRVLLLHVGKGYSLRETAVMAKTAGLAEVSDVALLKRLRQSEDWLLGLCQALLRETGLDAPPTPHCLRLVDGSIIKEPGKTGSQWRLHFSFTLPEFRCDHFELSPHKGTGTGETFSRYPVAAGDYIMGDRGYSTAKGIRHIASRKAYVLVRVNTASLPLYDECGKPFALGAALTALTQPFELGEWPVWVNETEDTGNAIAGRLCAVRKSEHAIAQAHKRLLRNASKKQKQLQPQTLEYAKYVLVFSTYPTTAFSATALLEGYRLRWQVELVFKRLKTLLDMGHLPKFDPQSARAWLYGKLFLVLLTEKLARISGAFSPWGYELSQPMA